MSTMIPQNDYNDRELMAFIGRQESQSIKTTSQYTDQIRERLKNGRELRGDPLPWSKTHSYVRCGEGQVSIWAGINGHKKSMLSGMVIQWFAKYGPVGIASFEMPVIDTMERMISQAAGCVPSVAFGEQWAEWGTDRLFFYDQLDSVPTERVLGAIFYMATECGCRHVMVDSLTKCGIMSGDKDGEKRFMDTLSAAAKALKIHIHIVAHVRKPGQGGDEYIPTRFDVRGAGELTDLVDNVFIVWADKKRERLARKEMNGTSITEKEKEYIDTRPDQRLIVTKQRFGRWEDTIALWFDDQSLQFMGHRDKPPLPLDLNEPQEQEKLQYG